MEDTHKMKQHEIFFDYYDGINIVLDNGETVSMEDMYDMFKSRHEHEEHMRGN